MKGNPAVPGVPLTSKPMWFSPLWVFNRIGFFFVFSGWVSRKDPSLTAFWKLALKGSVQ